MVFDPKMLNFFVMFQKSVLEMKNYSPLKKKINMQWKPFIIGKIILDLKIINEFKINYRKYKINKKPCFPKLTLFFTDNKDYKDITLLFSFYLKFQNQLKFFENSLITFFLYFY